MRFHFPKIDSRIIVEFVSVTFAVLLALIVNQLGENYSNKKLARHSLVNIKVEISENISAIETMIPIHEKLLDELDGLIKLEKEGKDLDWTDLDVNFILIRNTAWETAKLTEAISYINMDIVLDISMIYQLQDYYKDMVKDYSLRTMYTSSDIDEEKKKDFILSSSSFFKTITAIEKQLLVHYTREIEDLLPGS